MKSIFATVVSALLVVNVTPQSLPQVDLGYEVHQAITYNVSDGDAPSENLKLTYAEHISNVQL